MPTIQELSQFVAQPIDNLIAFGIIIALAIVLVIVIAAWKGAPAVFRLLKQQENTATQNAESIKQLTVIAQQNADQNKATVQSIERNTAEMSRQTASIEKQTGIIAIQGRDLRSYQTLVSDNLSAHAEQIAANTASIAALQESIVNLPTQIIEAIDDRFDCEKVLMKIADLREEVMGIIQKQKNKRDTDTGNMKPISEGDL